MQSVSLSITGIGYIPSQTKLTHMLTPENMTNELARRVLGLPVYIEHDTVIQIGEVSKAIIDDLQRLVVTMTIYHNSLIVSHLSDCIAIDGKTGRRALFTGISAGTRVQLARVNMSDGEHYLSTVGPASFTEFSIVETPDSPGCLITDWDFVMATGRTGCASP